MEILATTIHQTLDTPIPNDPIHLCGIAVQSDPDEALSLAQKEIIIPPHPIQWRRLFEDASLRKILHLCTQNSPPNKHLINTIISILDTALLTSGAPFRRDLIFTLITELEPFLPPQKTILPATFPSLAPPTGSLNFDIPIPHLNPPTLETFQARALTPLIIPGGVAHWPAISKWTSTNYWMNATLGGRRLVPVEIGRSYTDPDWIVKTMPFRDFLERLIKGERVYLAQHDLVNQIEELRGDVLLPDWSSDAPQPEGSDAGSDTSPPPSDNIQTNTWLGPSGTQTPPHRDPSNNVFCQVMGYKYLRLFPPGDEHRLAPLREKDPATGAEMGNTSSLDVDFFAFGRTSEGGVDVRGLEGILGPGDCVFIPKGWWHYVEALTTSGSVSFWW
ncbi:Clavaminate synthase-like protein [Piedraia hortae CBS 480.64]|uniref:Clavaminate synthase-like protein n=1 Tax=Piedraia hortae CBS 480.64 TaxID=1314780 RepID=A0A6A7C9X9_9PEZI|nr:Clavaminate synthase-like protein [Piedraia hortae CBS 480.64]